MTETVFILGRPGSGKSTATYRIAGSAWNIGWFVIRIRDYEILWQMYQNDTENKQFHSIEYNGFDVVDFSVLDLALQEVEMRVLECMSPANERGLIIIEFARDDYDKAFKLFHRDIIQNAYFLFIEADVETCIQRIRERVTHPLTADDNFVSDYMLKNYYHKDSKEYIASRLKADYNINKHIEIIDNMGSQQDFTEKVLRFAEKIFEQEI